MKNKKIAGIVCALIFTFAFPFNAVMASGDTQKAMPGFSTGFDMNGDGVLSVAGVGADQFSIQNSISATPASRYGVSDSTDLPYYAFAYFNDLIIRAANEAEKNIDVVIFSVMQDDIPNALLQAKARGVRVRLIIDENHVFNKPSKQIKMLTQNFQVRSLKGTQSWGCMHNKITLFDDKVLMTGSYNWTFSATFQNYENTIITKLPSYISGYRQYFNWMWRAARPVADGPNAAELPLGFYGAPPADPAPSIDFNGLRLPAYSFSPGGMTEDMLVSAIDASRRTIDAVTFTFSSTKLADAIVRAQKRGVRVRFMMDKNMATKTPLARQVINSGAEFKYSTGRKGKGAMHNKFAILDGRVLETGSFNWTSNAEVNSFENVILINNQWTIQAYQKKWQFLFDQAESPDLSTLPTNWPNMN